MSRRAAERGFETFVDATIRATHDEFSVERALRGTGFGLGGAVIDLLRENAGALERRIVEPELATYRNQSLEQLRVVLDYVESDEPIEAFEAELLEHDGYIDALKPTVTAQQRATVISEVRSRSRALGRGIEPIVDRPEDEFWVAAEAALTSEEAIALVENAFPFTGPLQQHPEWFAFEVRVDPAQLFGGPFARGFPSVEIEYTDEAIRSMRRGEQRIVDELTHEIRRRFDG